MPELPEVETTRRGVSPWLEGRSIERLEVREPRLRWPIPDAMPEWVQGLNIATLQRRAKYLLMPLLDSQQPESSQGLIWHLGMSGSLRLVPASEPWKKHDHLQLTPAPLPSETQAPLCLRYHDPRRFGFLLHYTGDPLLHPRLEKLGPEPLSDAFTPELLYQRSRQRKIPVKAFIMDSAQVVGVGNIYATEALFRAGIDPRRAAGRISLARYAELVRLIKVILAAAIEQGGTTLRDFVGGDGKPGYFAQQLDAYGRAGQPCRKCSAALQETRIGQRASVFCPQCQR
ncbi:bifunctional DNA-formamidopyrimidine glycosylase/DNA-(apurinic or apyrimidinic site) lyase [Marinospirillum sp.]|uniref:bifunctional DNA-formamidopyrimidine glycosylase/DNA-(apurinic or apyrimidinic site) lyase n=1 Tax=Marinospirillum sp. TaxID=2183934 RepID=UPI00287091A4|nr:bifunctional DNA-formamidopyrimidine glycosylase/DNA-(apurinic or apyrimidinic site) lyase [Marinospirillum sp.]MDR9469281.1 bifunctional DNA-formamidopyrimidine glycosylase/DNA-(apurinic or apyrimidinic site) lyase [Marinospirillum sp.]